VASSTTMTGGFDFYWSSRCGHTWLAGGGARRRHLWNGAKRNELRAHLGVAGCSASSRMVGRRRIGPRRWWPELGKTRLIRSLGIVGQSTWRRRTRTIRRGRCGQQHVSEWPSSTNARSLAPDLDLRVAVCDASMADGGTGGAWWRSPQLLAARFKIEAWDGASRRWQLEPGRAPSS
jgi:hypothetical protein